METKGNSSFSKPTLDTTTRKYKSAVRIYSGVKKSSSKVGHYFTYRSTHATQQLPSFGQHSDRDSNIE